MDIRFDLPVEPDDPLHDPFFRDWTRQAWVSHPHPYIQSSKINHGDGKVAQPILLQLDNYLGHGRLYDVYRGRLVRARSSIENESEDASVPVVAKFADFDTFLEQDSQGVDSMYVNSVGEAQRALWNEWAILQGPLASVQGVLVPKVYGMWTVASGPAQGEGEGEGEGGLGAAVMVLEDVGEMVFSPDHMGEMRCGDRDR